MSFRRSTMPRRVRGRGYRTRPHDGRGASRMPHSQAYIRVSWPSATREGCEKARLPMRGHYLGYHDLVRKLWLLAALVTGGACGRLEFEWRNLLPEL